MPDYFGALRRVERTRKVLVALAIFLIIGVALELVINNTDSSVKAEVPTHGIISIAFDDNYADQYDYAYPIMQAKGINGTFYVVTDHILGDSTYMSMAELQALQANGNEIGSHSVDHSDFTYLSDAQIRDQCSTSKQVLENNNLVVSNFAYPDGFTNDHIDSIVREYYRSGRTAYIAPYLTTLPVSQFRVPCFSNETAGTSPLASLEAIVDQAYSTNSCAIILFHHITPTGTEAYSTSTADFTSLLDYTIAKGVQTLTVNQTLNLVQLSMTTNSGTTSPANGIYNTGSTVTIQAYSPTTIEGERYIWKGWTGTGSGSYSGINNPAQITINGPINETASWKHEYKLTITTNLGSTNPSVGEYWYEAGSSVTVQAMAPSSDKNYTLIGWSGTGSVPISGSASNVTFTINSPSTIAWYWQTQYNLTFTLSGVSSDFSGTILTVNGTSYGKDGFSTLANAGDVYTFNYASELVVGANSKQYVLTGVSGSSSASVLSVSGTTTITGTYKPQYYLTVTSAYGSPLPPSGWYDSGSSITESVSTTTTGLDGTHYCTGWSGTGSVPTSGNASAVTFTINAPSKITWNWTTDTSFSPVIIAGLIIAVVALASLGFLTFYKKRGRHTTKLDQNKTFTNVFLRLIFINILQRWLF